MFCNIKSKIFAVFFAICIFCTFAVGCTQNKSTSETSSVISVISETSQSEIQSAPVISEKTVSKSSSKKSVDSKTQKKPSEKKKTASENTSSVSSSSEVKNQKAPLIWKVTDKNGGFAYLFGTIHLGTSYNKKVVEALKKTLSECDRLAVEFDIIEYENDEQKVNENMRKYVYTDGTKVSDHLKGDLYNKLKLKLVREVGDWSDSFDRMNLAYWESALTNFLVDDAAVYDSNNGEKALAVTYGADRLLLKAAKENGMDIIDVESPEEQMNLTLNLSDDVLNLMISDELETTAEEYSKALHKLYDGWKIGDLTEIENNLYTLTDEERKELDKQTVQMIDDYDKKMIDDRNAKMFDSLKIFLKENGKTFFAVGAAHMIGEKGIINLLKNSGYTVEQMYVDVK